MATADVLNQQQVLEQEYDSTVRADIELFRSQAQDFLAGKLTADEFRPFRLRRGIYGQRQEGVQMIRTKIPGGLLTSGQMRQMAAVADFCATAKAISPRGRTCSITLFRWRRCPTLCTCSPTAA